MCMSWPLGWAANMQVIIDVFAGLTSRGNKEIRTMW